MYNASFAYCIVRVNVSESSPNVTTGRKRLMLRSERSSAFSANVLWSNPSTVRCPAPMCNHTLTVSSSYSMRRLADFLCKFCSTSRGRNVVISLHIIPCAQVCWCAHPRARCARTKLWKVAQLCSSFWRSKLDFEAPKKRKTACGARCAPFIARIAAIFHPREN